MIDILILLLVLIGVAFIAASLTSLLTFMFEDGHLLSFYPYYLAWFLVKKDATFHKEFESMTDAEGRRDYVIGKAYKESFVFKPMGGCGVCFNVWISFVVGLCASYFIGFHVGLIFVIASVSTGFFMLISRE